jgi:hypothetical protein
MQSGESMGNSLGRLGAGIGLRDRITPTALEQVHKSDGTDHARTAFSSLDPTCNVINSLHRSIKVALNAIRHHLNRHMPSLQCLGTLP